MPKPKQFGKRKVRPNQHSLKKKLEKAVEKERVPEASASKQKINSNTSDLSSDSDFCSDNNNVIISLSSLNMLLNAVSQCKNCGDSGSFVVEENRRSRKGLAVKISASCKSCGYNDSVMSSTRVPSGFEVNLRFVYGMRCVGRGKGAASTFCAIMNLPSPPAKFERYYPTLHKALKTVSSSSMSKSVEEAVVTEEGTDISIALDGSWQKRGHTSKLGVITATSLDNGKVVDFECLSKFCYVCKMKGNNCPNCQSNYEGYSAGMESEGVHRIFQRSVSTQNVRYVEYLGDGDSKGFTRIEQSNVYGEDVVVKKLECVGHVQKRMGARLRSLKNSLKSSKLSDNKPISGRGRLTDAEILLLQKYYGLAIRRNEKKTVAEMAQAIWAIYFHKLSTDQNPQHALCPMGDDSWCGYNKSISTLVPYSHEHSLPEPVLLAMKDVFRALTSKDLLQKCLHGRTQNPNESFNNCVWLRIPKNIFISKRTLEIGVMDAVICFNDGAAQRIEVLKELKIVPGLNTSVALRKIDKTRICEAEIIMQKTSKEARTLKRHIQRQQEAMEIANQDEYSPGNY